MVRNILYYLENSADRFPNKKAFIGEQSSLTFQELKDSAQRIGTILADSIHKGQPVAVYMDKTPEAIAAFMGVVYAGGVYVPIDVSMPQRRVKIILDTLKTDVIIVDEQSQNKLDDLGFAGRSLNYNDIIDSEVDANKLNQIRKNHIDNDPLYIIFTSGSTGTPKGVVLSHRAVIDLAEWIGETFNFNNETVFGNQTPFYFDASVKEIYSTIRNASTTFIIPQTFFGFPKKLFPYLNEHKINTIAWATSAICIASNEKYFDQCCPQYLKTVFFAGEPMPVHQLNIWRHYLPNIQYVNLYGPTEAAVDSTFYIVNREFKDMDALPIGYPCANTDILILKDNILVSGNEIGEICIRGTSLSNGYYNNAEKTAEVFVQNPLQSAYPELIYRTGDMGYYNEYGEIMFAARQDDQIKHQGYRIELGEIETAISSINGIDRCCCLFDQSKDSIICIYAGTIDKKEVVIGISKIIPKYMWPTVYIKLDQLPLNLNGKIDRVQLKKEYIG